MTRIDVHSAVFYLTDTDAKWRDSDFKAMNVVKAFKDEHFNGYITLKPLGNRRLTFSDRSLIRTTVYPFLAQRITDHIKEPFDLVPVPDSATFVGAQSPGRAERFARELAAAVGPAAHPRVSIRWKATRDPQHDKAGHRLAAHFVDQLVVVQPPTRPVVLIDDMITSGSQMLACTRLLKEAGADVRFGVVVGRRTKEQVQNPLDWHSETAEQAFF